MVYGFARVGAALAMRVEDVYVQNRRLWVRLREKGGKPQALPCHHTLQDYLVAYLDGAGLRGDPKGPLFRTLGRGTGRLSERPLPQASAHAMVRRRVAAAGIATPLGSVLMNRGSSCAREFALDQLHDGVPSASVSSGSISSTTRLSGSC